MRSPEGSCYFSPSTCAQSAKKNRLYQAFSSNPSDAGVTGSFARPAPREGSMIIAQGKAAALCSAHPTSSLPFFLVCRAGPPAGTAIQEKGEECLLHA